MARKKKTRVFISYSRHDEAIVKPLAGLLNVASDESVFLDVNDISPGDDWMQRLMGAIQEASVFILCWCCESKNSDFVAKEIAKALLDEHKRLVPVLFCSSDLPEDLAKKQWIDLRGRINHSCSGNHAEDLVVEKERTSREIFEGGSAVYCDDGYSGRQLSEAKAEAEKQAQYLMDALITARAKAYFATLGFEVDANAAE